MSEPITIVLVLISTLVSIAAFNDRRVFEALLFEPFVIKARGQWYRFVSHAFIHANWPHLIVNMFVLYMFGCTHDPRSPGVESLLGTITGGPVLLPYLALYLGGILFSSLPSYKKHLHDPGYRAVGASGAVSAVLFAHILFLPTRSVGLLVLPIGHGVPAWAFGVLYLVYSWYMDKRGGDNVAHDAHFYGALYGVIFTTALEPQLLLNIGSFQRSLGL